MPWTPQRNLSLKIALTIAPVFALVLATLGLLSALREATLFTEDLHRDARAVAHSVSALLPQESWEVAEARVAELDRQVPWLTIRLVPLDGASGPRTVAEAKAQAQGYNVVAAFYAETVDRPVAVVVAEPLAPRDAFVARALLLDATAVVIATAAASFFALQVGRRLVAARVEQLRGRLAEVARQQAGGAPLDLGPDELGELARAVNALTDQLTAARATAAAEAEARRSAQLSLRRAERLAAVGRTVAVLAHEIGTPLNVILGRAERLKGNPSPEVVQRSAGAIAEQTERLGLFLRRLLDYSRHDDSFVLRRIALQAPAEAAVALLQAQARGRAITVVTLVDPQPVPVLGDATSLQQVVTNLLSNAFDASPPGGVVELTVTAAGERARLVVRDQGPGFPPGLEQKVLEPFFTTKAPGQGTGLGLAVVREIVEDHGGQLHLGRHPEGGAQVSVELPLGRDP